MNILPQFRDGFVSGSEPNQVEEGGKADTETTDQETAPLPYPKTNAGNIEEHPFDQQGHLQAMVLLAC